MTEFEISDNYEEKRKKEDIRTPDTPIINPPRTEQPTSTPESTPVEALGQNEPTITEIPVEAPKQPKESRELKNLESGLNGPSWRCTTDHGRRMRVRAVGLEDEYNESWDNVRLLDEEEDRESDNEPMEKRD